MLLRLQRIKDRRGGLLGFEWIDIHMSLNGNGYGYGMAEIVCSDSFYKETWLIADTEKGLSYFSSEMFLKSLPDYQIVGSRFTGKPSYGICTKCQIPLELEILENVMLGKPEYSDSLTERHALLCPLCLHEVEFNDRLCKQYKKGEYEKQLRKERKMKRWEEREERRWAAIELKKERRKSDDAIQKLSEEKDEKSK